MHQKIYLIRHGETEWSRAKKHTGLTDIPLTEEGREQALWLKNRLSSCKFKHVFTSPLQRASETCDIAGFGHEKEIMQDLVEWDYGDYEGKTTAEIKEKVHGWTLFTKGVPNGESFGDVGTRAQRVISYVRNIRGDVALFSSGHFLRCLAAKWLHMPISEGKLLALSTASVSMLGFERECPVLMLWNETPS